MVSRDIVSLDMSRDSGMVSLSKSVFANNRAKSSLQPAVAVLLKLALPITSHVLDILYALDKCAHVSGVRSILCTC